MHPLAGDFTFSRREHVIYGAGKIATLESELSRLNAKRTVLVTTKTLARSALIDKVKAAIGPGLAAVFSETFQHVPSKTVDALVADARRVDADSFVSFGGGTPIDTAKDAVMVMLGGVIPRGDAPDLFAKSSARPDGDYPHIAVSTTLSAGEFTPFSGMTDEETRIKGGVGDPRLQPRCVILDPEVTLETPAWLWAGTGIRALDHAVESAYSNRHNPISDTLSAESIALLSRHLKQSLQGGADQLYYRGQCQIAAWTSVFANAGGGISHALGHQIGPSWDVPHGFTSCIMLPPTMRFMAEVSPERFAPIAEGLGISFDTGNPRRGALECADRVAHLISDLDVPTRLRDVEVPRSELSRIAHTVLLEVSRSRAVDREITLEDLNRILEAAF